MIFFYTICRSLIRTFLPTTYELVLWIRMSAQHNTNLYHLCLLTTYKLVYYGREILRIRMFTTYELVYGRDILQIRMFSTIQIQYYKLVRD